MNIFSVHSDPVISAKQLCNKHVVKMPTESVQLLATCFSLDRLAAPDCPRTLTGKVRGHFNPKHPSALFVRKSKLNMLWLLEHCQAMIDEKHRRYPKGGTHFAIHMLNWVIANMDKDAEVPEGDLTDFIPAISVDAVCRQKCADFNSLDSVSQYKQYYIHDKVDIAVWPTIGDVPDWWPYDKVKFIQYK